MPYIHSTYFSPLSRLTDLSLIPSRNSCVQTTPPASIPLDDGLGFYDAPTKPSGASGAPIVVPTDSSDDASALLQQLRTDSALEELRAIGQRNELQHLREENARLKAELASKDEKVRLPATQPLPNEFSLKRVSKRFAHSPPRSMLIATRMPPL